MATYCFICTACGLTVQKADRIPPYCIQPHEHLVEMSRDYRAEGVGVAVENLRREREHSKEEYAAAFLPSNDDFKSPADPEGKKGMEEWRTNFGPAESNKRPYWPGDVDKKVF